MMRKTMICAAAMLAAPIAPASATTLYGVDEANNLVRFDSAAPATLLASVAIQGIAGSSVLAMDFRPNTGVLYALTNDFRLFTVNEITGATGLIATLALTGSNFAFDFNPTNNNLRIVSDNNTNYVYNFATNAIVPGVAVAYDAGPLNGVDPDITAAGYLNNDVDGATGTTLFVIDSLNDVLATQNPTTGVLTLVGALGVDVGARTSFDISTVGGVNSAFVQNGNTLYSLNTGTGALTSIGTTNRTLFALTAAPPVPEPATWAMMIAGFGMVGMTMRRRRVSFATA